MTESRGTDVQQKPLISIITVVFNSAPWLEQTISSVLAQSEPNIEYIIIDGGSTDGTLEIIKRYESQITCWISESDRGIYDAMNKGIRLAQGEIIGILNSGDLYAPNALKIVSQIYRQYQERYLIITGAMVRFASGNAVKFVQHRTQADLKGRINLGMPINHPATFVTKSVYQTIGDFNAKFKIAGDYDFIYRAYHDGRSKFIFTDGVLSSMSMGGISERPASLPLRAREGFRVRHQQLGLLPNAMLSLRIIFIGYIKYLLTAIMGQKAVLLRHQLEQKAGNLSHIKKIADKS